MNPKNEKELTQVASTSAKNPLVLFQPALVAMLSIALFNGSDGGNDKGNNGSGGGTTTKARYLNYAVQSEAGAGQTMIKPEVV